MSTVEAAVRALPKHMEPNTVVAFKRTLRSGQKGPYQDYEAVEHVWVIRYDSFGARAEQNPEATTDLDQQWAMRVANVEHRKLQNDPGRERMTEPWLNYVKRLAPGLYEISTGAPFID